MSLQTLFIYLFWTDWLFSACERIDEIGPASICLLLFTEFADRVVTQNFFTHRYQELM